jgi:hypothetical protein
MNQNDRKEIQEVIRAVKCSTHLRYANRKGIICDECITTILELYVGNDGNLYGKCPDCGHTKRVGVDIG